MKNKWFIALKKRGSDMTDLSDLTIVPSPEGCYFADPFLAEENGKTYLFYEDYDYEKGRIAVAEVEGLEVKNHRVIIDEPYHMSFPSVVKFKGEWYMTPERCLAGELLVYKAVSFPDVWEPVASVSTGRFDDPVMREKDGALEIWCSTDGDNLRVFRSDSIEGPWGLIFAQEQPFARAAGHFIGPMRIAQDSVPTYGRAIKFLEQGKVIYTIEPDWYPQLTGTHTFNVSEKYVVLDGRIAL